jgi:predicted aspartyl protease
MSARKGNDSLNMEGQIGDKSCLMTIDTGASVTIVRLDITAGLPVRELTRPYVLQMLSGKTLLILKEALVELTLGHCPLTTWLFVTKVTDEFILGLDGWMLCVPTMHPWI